MSGGITDGGRRLGAHPDEATGRCHFELWAPLHDHVELSLVESGRTLPMQRDEAGYHTVTVDGLEAGARYLFRLPDGRELPDPASRWQPDGVHGPSAVFPASFDWETQEWPAPELRDLVLYELHVGTFTPEGTFDAIIQRLPALRKLGVNALELLPVAQFPGTRNWGYDGVFAFAAQDSYGGPAGLKRLVDAAHAAGMWVFLDVVYNHLGPEGNYLPSYGNYFTDVYHTPWGAALNFDEAHSDDVRRYFIESALQWLDEFRVDGFRLDAVHAVHDRSAQPFLREITDAIHDRAARLRRTAVVIAESDLGDPRVIRPPRLGGWGMDAQWLDDFHHALRAMITGERDGYYVDFGLPSQFATAWRNGYVYAGDYSRYRKRRHGAPGPDLLARQFVVYTQNHDQVGNRMRGDRLTTTVGADRLRFAAAATLLSPFTPMLFMGEEYAETRPFPYFISHGDAELVEAVRKGRAEEFASFSWQGKPPDPAGAETYHSAVLDWDNRESADHGRMLALYTELLRIRREAHSIRAADALTTELLGADGSPASDEAAEALVVVRRRATAQSSMLFLNAAAHPVHATVHAGGGTWRLALDTSDEQWGGAGGAEFQQQGPAVTVHMPAWSAMLILHDEVQ